MKAKDISAKSIKELESLEAELRGKIITARLDLSSRKTPNVKTVKNLKVDLARTLSFKRAKELEAKSG